MYIYIYMCVCMSYKYIYISATVPSACLACFSLLADLLASGLWSVASSKPPPGKEFLRDLFGLCFHPFSGNPF